ncbi:hypothetical protein K502DRAFT_325189, partial [Neoconidiobolus thromboides FSU 785]
MYIELNLLPGAILKGVFEYIDIIELFKLQSISKRFQQIIRNQIFINLTYSEYQKFKEANKRIQHNFIKENPNEMKKLSVSSVSQFESLNSCQYIKCLHFSLNSKFKLSKNGHLIHNEFLSLKKLSVDVNYEDFRIYFDLFKSCLHQLSELKLISKALTLSDVLEYLNKTGLKVLKIKSIMFLDLNGIEALKQFKNLTTLHLTSYNMKIPRIYNKANNFIKLKELKIKGKMDDNYNLDYFGDLTQLHKLIIKLQNFKYDELVFKDSRNVKIRFMGFIQKLFLNLNSLDKMLNLNEISINKSELFEEIVHGLSEPNNVQSIKLYNSNYLEKDSFKLCQFDWNSDDDVLENPDYFCLKNQKKLIQC